MTNNDTKFGTFNKKTHIYHQTDEDGTPEIHRWLLPLTKISE